MRRGSVAGLLAALSPLAAAQIALGPDDEPTRVHWVQLRLFESLASAEAFAASLRDEGIAPVCVYPSSRGPAVRVGEFAVHMDAELCAENLRDRFPDAWVRFNSVSEEAQAGRRWDFTPVSAISTTRELFALSGNPMPPSAGVRFINALCAIPEGGVYVPGTLPEDEATLELVAEELIFDSGPEDLAAGEGSLQMAGLLARRREFDYARAMALPVASGTILATPQDRWDAMWLLARIYHAKRWRRTAYRAYVEIAAAAADPRDRVRALVEQAGLLFELSESGSGRMADARLRCAEILRAHGGETDPEIRALVATAAQIRAETFYMEDRFEESVAALQEVARVYGDVRRVHAMALFFQAHALHRLNRRPEAQEVMSQVAEMQLGPGDNFPRLDLSTQALGNLTLEAIHDEDWDAALERIERLSQRAPRSASFRQCLRRLRQAEGLSGDQRQRLEALASPGS